MSSYFSQIFLLVPCHSKGMISNKKIFRCESKILLSLKYNSRILQFIFSTIVILRVHDYTNPKDEGDLTEARGFSPTLMKLPKHERKRVDELFCTKISCIVDIVDRIVR